MALAAASLLALMALTETAQSCSPKLLTLSGRQSSGERSGSAIGMATMKREPDGSISFVADVDWPPHHSAVAGIAFMTRDGGGGEVIGLSLIHRNIDPRIPPYTVVEPSTEAPADG